MLTRESGSAENDGDARLLSLQMQCNSRCIWHINAMIIFEIIFENAHVEALPGDHHEWDIMQVLSTDEKRVLAVEEGRGDREAAARRPLPCRGFPNQQRPRRFLEAFPAILKHTNYRLALDHYVRVSAKCSRCSVPCQVYLATMEPRDIPCYRSTAALSLWRHFTVSGALRGRVLGDTGLIDEKIQEMAASSTTALPAGAAAQCPDGDRPWPDHSSGALHPVRDRHCPPRACRQHTGTAVRLHWQHFRHSRSSSPR